MSGFKNKTLNEIAKINMFEDMINFIFISLENMKNDLTYKNKKVKNNEEKIRNYLLENYLNNPTFKNNVDFSDLYLLFEKEVPEGYDAKENKYVGRVDIKVFSVNTLINNPKDYYIIECKRIDGSSILNREFVKEGIYRFILENPKYSSFHRKNIMLGFVVNDIDINENYNKIEDIQDNNNNTYIIEEKQKIEMKNKDFYLYRNKYTNIYEQIDLYHMFYKLCDVVG